MGGGGGRQQRQEGVRTPVTWGDWSWHLDTLFLRTKPSGKGSEVGAGMRGEAREALVEARRRGMVRLCSLDTWGPARTPKTSLTRRRRRRRAGRSLGRAELPSGRAAGGCRVRPPPWYSRLWG